MTLKFLCQSCEHFRGGGRCDAFPAGIPDEILTGDNDHSGPVDGDGGIRYEGVPVLRDLFHIDTDVQPRRQT